MIITRAREYSLKQFDEYHQLLKEEDAFEFYRFYMTLSMKEHIDLYNSFEAGNKVSGKEAADNLLERGWEEYHDKQR